MYMMTAAMIWMSLAVSNDTKPLSALIFYDAALQNTIRLSRDTVSLSLGYGRFTTHASSADWTSVNRNMSQICGPPLHTSPPPGPFVPLVSLSLPFFSLPYSFGSVLYNSSVLSWYVCLCLWSLISGRTAPSKDIKSRLKNVYIPPIEKRKKKFWHATNYSRGESPFFFDISSS